jgi:hypothetical protein
LLILPAALTGVLITVKKQKMWQVTAIHVKMMLRYFVGNNHKVIWVLLVMLVLFWLELTQWLPIFGFCSIFFAVS